MPNGCAWTSRWRVPLGFALAAAFVILAQPSTMPLLCGAALMLAGLLLRGWSAGYLAKNQRLVMGGPYSHTRNPLYLGSAMIGLGAAVAGRSWILGVAFTAFFALVYRPVMKREAEFLRGEFPEAFEQYAKRVPFFLPKFRGISAGSEKFQWPLYFKNREYEAATGYVAAVLFLVLKMWLR